MNARDDALTMWTVYDHPRDCPDFFIAREWRIVRGRTLATDRVVMAYSLDVIRDAMLKHGLTCITRSPEDDPTIVETWL